MTPTASIEGALAELARAAGRWLAGWWRIVRLAAVLLAMALSPSSYDRAEPARAGAPHRTGTAPALLWFTVLSTLISLVRDPHRASSRR